MKLAYLILAFILTTTHAFSDDLIIKKDGELTQCDTQKENSASVEDALAGKNHLSGKYNNSKGDIDSIGSEDKTTSTKNKHVIEDSPTLILCANFHREYERFLGLYAEFLIVDYLGGHVCGGLLGAGAGFDFHISPSIRSSSFNISYLYMNYDSDNKSSIIASFTFRTKYYFQLQAGAAYHTSREVEGYGIYNGDFQQSPAVSLLLGVGFYYPF